jgi:hypothetical protein
VPTVRYRCTRSWYSEIAPLDFQWREWSPVEGNIYGLRSHSIRLLDYDGDNAVRGFASMGFRTAGATSPGGRRLRQTIEGSHESGGGYVFRVPLPRGTVCTDVRLHTWFQSVPLESDWVARVFAVAADDFYDRQASIAVGYPVTLRSEAPAQAAYYGRLRRYITDSLEHDQEHTEACVSWPLGEMGAYAEAVSPDLSAIFNEILSRPPDSNGYGGWKANNRIGLCVRPQATPPTDSDTTPFNPDFSGSGMGAGYGWSFVDEQGWAVIKTIGGKPQWAKATDSPFIEITYE